MIEVIRSIQNVIAQKFINGPVPLVAARLGNDDDLRSRPLAVFRAVGVAQHIELAHRFHAYQILTRSARLHVVLRGAGELYSVQQKQILLRTIP